MKKAAIPKNESERIESLSRLEILDTIPEKEYDEIVELASQICQTPIALFSIVDRERQWFKAKKGLTATETHRDLAFCAHAILEENVFEIQDSFQDERFKDNPLATDGPNVRFYAGAQVISPEGFKIGTLCAIDNKPKKLTDEQKKSLQILANQVSKNLALRKKIFELEESQQQLIQSNKEKLEAQTILASNSKLVTMGEMMSGIAHEINNPLAIIQGKAFQLKRRYHNKNIQTESTEKDIELIESTADRIAKIIRGLKNFARNAENDPFEFISIDKVMQDTLDLCFEKLQHRKIEFKKNGNPTDLQIECRPVQLTQVFMNLISNSIDALEKNTEKWIEIQWKQENERVLISLTDSGSGIPDSIIDKIMNAFFTTKDHTKGTGLGLSISKKIIESHHGDLEYNKNHSHTQFIISLPIRQLKVVPNE